MAHGVVRRRSGLTGELVVRATDGDQDAWNVLVERYSGMLWSIARAHDLDPPDAMDVVQTTWLRLVENVGSVRDPERVGAWLAVTARRESIRTLRLLARERAGPTEKAAGGPVPRTASASSHTKDPLDLTVTRERQRLLVAAVRQLPARCRQLIRMLTTAPPSSYAEISAALDMPVGSIGPTRARCLAHLRRRLAGRKP